MASVLAEKDAIRELLAAYCFHFDNGEFDAWIELFAADGVFDLGERGRFVGHESLRAFLQRLPLTEGLPMMRHCSMNSIVQVDGASATARSYVVVLRAGEPPVVSLAGRYADRLVKTAAGWRFAERKVHFDLTSQG